jgi:hypothetical protein
MSYEEALEVLSRDERFHATIYAMNSLLIHKGIYTRREYESLFIEWANKETKKKARTTHSPILAHSAQA